MAGEIEDTFDKLKAGAKAVAKKVTDPSKDLGDEYDKERGKDNPKIQEHDQSAYKQTSRDGTSDPMSHEKIVSHEPTAVRRDSNQDSSGEPVSSQDRDNTGFQAKQMGTSSGKSDESTPGVSATFSCQECGKAFSSRRELKDHTQQQH